MYRSPLRLSLAFALLGLVAPAEAQGPLTDAHGDPLPPGALARMGTVRFRHGGGLHWGCRLYAVAYSPNGKVLASAGADNTVRLWDAATGKPLAVLRLTGVPRVVAFAPDGQTVAFAGTLGELGVADVTSGKLIHQFRRSKEDVLAVAFSPDGKTLASGGADNTVRLWNYASGQELSAFAEHAGPVFWLTFTDQGKTLVSASADGSVRFWEAATGKERTRFQGQHKALYRAALAPDGKTLAVCAVNGPLLLWDVAKDRATVLKGAALKSAPDRLEDMAFTRDGKCLVGVGSEFEPAISVWDAATGKELRGFRLPYDLRYMTLALHGDTAAVTGSDNTVRFWDVRTGKERLLVVGLTGPVGPIAVSPDGSKIATTGKDSSTYLWEAGTGKLLHSWDTAYRGLQILAFSPDGKTLAAVHNYEVGDEVVLLWSVATGRTVGKMLAPRRYGSSNGTGSLLFSRDGQTLIAAGALCRVYDVAAARHVRDLPFYSKDVALSPDERTLAATSKELLSLWDLETGKEVRQFGLGPTFQTVQFVGAGRLLTSSGEHVVSLWETKPGGRLLRHCTLPSFRAFAASPDGRLLATCGDKWRGREQLTPESFLVRVYEACTGQEIARFAGHTGALWEAPKFTPDGRRLVSGGNEGTTLVWDLTGRVRDGKLQPAVLDDKALATAWQELAGDKVPQAYRAVWALVACPDKSVPFLEKHLRLDPKAAALARLRIADLADDEDKVRARAIKELLELGAVAVPALQKTLQGKPPIQVRERVTQLLERLEPLRVAALHRQLRATLVLEQVGGKEARAVLQELVRDGLDEAVRLEAMAGLERLKS